MRGKTAGDVPEVVAQKEQPETGHPDWRVIHTYRVSGVDIRHAVPLCPTVIPGKRQVPFAVFSGGIRMGLFEEYKAAEQYCISHQAIYRRSYEWYVLDYTNPAGNGIARITDGVFPLYKINTVKSWRESGVYWSIVPDVLDNEYVTEVLVEKGKFKLPEGFYVGKDASGRFQIYDKDDCPCALSVSATGEPGLYDGSTTEVLARA
jgi:hypothetical protein